MGLESTVEIECGSQDMAFIKLCQCVCVWARARACVHACVHACHCVYVYITVQVCVRAGVCACVHVCVHVCVSALASKIMILQTSATNCKIVP